MSQTHRVSPLTELLNWLAVKNRSIPPLSLTVVFFPFFTSLAPTLCLLSPTLDLRVWEERPLEEITRILIKRFRSWSEFPPPYFYFILSPFFFFNKKKNKKQTDFKKKYNKAGPICLWKLTNTCRPSTQTSTHTHSWAWGSQGPWLCGVLWSEILMQRFKAHTNPL